MGIFTSLIFIYIFNSITIKSLTFKTIIKLKCKRISIILKVSKPKYYPAAVGGWLQTILQVKKLDVDVHGWPGDMWLDVQPNSPNDIGTQGLW